MAWGHTAILQFAFYNLTFALSFSCLRAFVAEFCFSWVEFDALP
jgi:hypothetical protein